MDEQLSQRIAESHRARRIAESFGTDPDRYDRTRPRYPQAMGERILDGAPGRDVLDVGAGTGIAARQFQVAKASDGIRQTGGFGETEEWRVAWKRTYSRDEWLDQGSREYDAYTTFDF